MKKVLTGLILTLFLAGLIVPVLVSAQVPEVCTVGKKVAGMPGICATGTPPGTGTTSEGAKINVELFPMCCLINTIYTVTDWIFVILIALVAVMVIAGAFTLATAAGAPEKVTSGRNYIIYAMIGMVVALLAKAIPAIVRGIMGL